MIKMKYKEFEDKISLITDKIGNDSSNLILDDVAVLLTDNQQMNNELETKDKEIESLKSSIDKLQKVNGNLLLQIPAIKEVKEEPKRREYHSMRDSFDEKGNFKR